ncbi:hypothetical protein [Leucobacter ruminantium]|uniref:Uncharacterized protein n=1 Tax=Leucobacter ruminantium TaxID=1289170 RepID=A0A939LW22_9MICO|nr:hypothetical protein [Leucobacter ruminantium]MBO1805859.1 hypothetical protein [Leucobacter ruminantium]
MTAIEILERAISKLETLRDEATGEPGKWRWYDYGKSGRTLAAPNPIPGPVDGYFGQMYGHDLNVLKTTDDWPPTLADAELIVALSRTVEPMLDTLRFAQSLFYVPMYGEQAAEIVQHSLAIARAILGEENDHDR